MINDHVSFGSHDQYVPHAEFAHTEPVIMPIVRKRKPNTIIWYVSSSMILNAGNRESKESFLLFWGLTRYMILKPNATAKPAYPRKQAMTWAMSQLLFKAGISGLIVFSTPGDNDAYAMARKINGVAKTPMILS